MVFVRTKNGKEYYEFSIRINARLYEEAKRRKIVFANALERGIELICTEQNLQEQKIEQKKN